MTTVVPVYSNDHTLRAGLPDRLLNACDLFAINIPSYSVKNHSEIFIQNKNSISLNAAG